MLNQLKIGRTKEVAFDVTRKGVAVASLSGTAKVFTKGTSTQRGSDITLALTIPDEAEVAGRIWCVIPTSITDILEQDEEIELRASISGTGITTEDQSRFYVAGRWE